MLQSYSNGAEQQQQGGRTHLVLFTLVQYLQCLHGPDHRLHGSEDVLVHQLGETLFVLLRVPGTVDYPHLFNECALPALPCACK